MLWIAMALAGSIVRLDADQKVWVNDQLCGELSTQHDYLTSPCPMPEDEVVVEALGNVDGIYHAMAWVHGAQRALLQTPAGLLAYDTTLSAARVQSRPPLMVKLYEGLELLVERGSAKMVLPPLNSMPDWQGLSELLRLDHSLQPESYFVIGADRSLPASLLLQIAALGKSVGFESFVLIDTPSSLPPLTNVIPLPPPGQPYPWPKAPTRPDSPAEALKPVIAAHFPALTRCYQTGLKRQPDLYGTLNIALRIGPDGVVQTAEIQNSTLTGKQANRVHQCLESELLKISFPASDTGIFVSYPLVFSP